MLRTVAVLKLVRRAAPAGVLLAISACNVALGGGAAALVGGSAVLASQCYDQVYISVRDATGSPTCDARVYVVDADGDARRLQPCYSASLTEGKWRVIAKREGYADATTSITVADHDDCPYYTHSIEITMRRIGESVVATTVVDHSKAPPRPTTPAPAAAPAAAVEPPTRAFDLLAPPAPPASAPAATAPGTPPAAPTPPSAPAPTPGPPEPL
jgi:hypothetical protein